MLDFPGWPLFLGLLIPGLTIIPQTSGLDLCKARARAGKHHVAVASLPAYTYSPFEKTTVRAQVGTIVV